MIHVIVADDRELARETVCAVLRKEKDIRVVGQAQDGQQAVEFAAHHRVDAVIMDAAMPVLNGLKATRLLNQQCPTTRILVMSGTDEEDLPCKAFSEGAMGYLSKYEVFAELGTAIRAICSGKRYVSQSIREQYPALEKYGPSFAPQAT